MGAHPAFVTPRPRSIGAVGAGPRRLSHDEVIESIKEREIAALQGFPLVAHLGPPAMSAFLPLLGNKRTSNAPSPGVLIYEYTTQFSGLTLASLDNLKD